jgi:hypothetical protein
MADLSDQSTDVSLHSASDNTQKIEMILDGSIYRLPVDANATIVNNESPTRYQLKTDYDASTGSSLVTGSDTTLYTYSGDGTLSAVAVTNPNTSNYEVVIDIDGTERLRITMSDIGSTLGLTDGAFPIWATNANKQFRFHPTPELGFTTGFTIKARATTGSTTVYHFVMFKERV